jgi:hypothetical protein
MNNCKPENLRIENKYSKVKTVSFSNDAKSYDGTSQKNIIYSNIIINFFKKKIKTPFDILNITSDKKMLEFFIEESDIAKTKLEYFNKTNQNIFFKFLSYTKSSKEKSGISIVRSGSRDINLKFLPSHLKNINKLINLFNSSLKILQTI